MASLRPSLLLQRASSACRPRPWLQLLVRRPAGQPARTAATAAAVVTASAPTTKSTQTRRSNGRRRLFAASGGGQTRHMTSMGGGRRDNGEAELDKLLTEFHKSGFDAEGFGLGEDGGDGSGGDRDELGRLSLAASEAAAAALDAEEALLKPGMTRLTGYARALPASPSYFSRQPAFNDRFLELQALYRRYGHLPLVPAEQTERVAWKTVGDYRVATGEDVKAPQYNRCLAMVKHLHRIHPSLRPAGVAALLDEFQRQVNPFTNVPRARTLDRFGRAVGVGRRKTSVARAWVVEGTGEVLVNGKSLSAAFGRVHDRESATWALRATDRVDKYNVWALVEGGGTTGQAEALTLAVAKGLIAHEPALKTALRKAGCIQRDPRMVERKKHGHVKARKMPAWVKR